MSLVTLDPTGARAVDTYSIAPRLSGLNGKRVGLLHNVKTNAKELVSDIFDLLKERYDVWLVGPMLTAGQSGMLAKPGATAGTDRRRGRRDHGGGRLRVLHGVQFAQRHRTREAGHSHRRPVHGTVRPNG